MMDCMAKKPGRPKLPDEKRHSNRLLICLTPAERQVLEKAAQSENMEVSTWIREMSLRAAQERG